MGTRLINDDTANTYYNCESVIAVGEVKSDASIYDVRDSIDKLVKVKQLKRYNDNGYVFRKYFSPITITDSLKGNKIPYNSDDNNLAQIYTFLLCKSLNTPIDSIVKCLNEKCTKQHTFLNRIISTTGDYIAYLDIDNTQYNSSFGRVNSNAIYNLKNNKYSFNHFICDIISFISHGTTVPINYDKYLSVPLTSNDIKEIIEL